MKVLIIKGNKFEAESAAMRRGVSLTVMFESEGHRETVAHSEADVVDLNKWFCEETTEAPYPPGSLLYYGEKPAKSVMSEAEYVEHRGLMCPVCKSENIEAEEVNIDAGTAWQEISCKNCNSRWEDSYTLTGYSNLVRGDEER